MLIAIDMLLVEQGQSAAQRTTASLLNELAARSTHQYIVITGRPGMYSLQKRASNVRLYPVKVDAGHAILTWHQLLLPAILRRLQPDVLHIPGSAIPIGWDGPVVMIMYDLVELMEWPTTMHQYVQLYNDRLLCESMHRAQGILVPLERLEYVEHLCAKLKVSRYGTEKRVYSIDDRMETQLVLRVYDEVAGYGNSEAEMSRRIEEGEKGEEVKEVAGSQLETSSLVVHHDSEHRRPEKVTLPSVSVIMPATRLEHAQRALEGLSRQCYPGQLEVIVVGPPALELAKVRSIRVIHPEAIYTPGKARNLGAAQANGDLLLFLDDDMLVEPDWIEQNVRALQQRAIGAVGARMPGKAQTFYARCADFTNYGHYQHTRAMDQLLGAGSMGIHKTVFTELGGFDERLHAAEDIELCYRIQQLGYHTLYQPEIVAIHDHHYDTLARLLRYNYNHGFQGGWQAKTYLRREGPQPYFVDILRNILLHYPLLFLPLLPLIALLATIRIIRLNIDDHRRILLYVFHIFLGKIAYQSGVFMHLMKGKKVR